MITAKYRMLTSFAEWMRKITEEKRTVPKQKVKKKKKMKPK